MGTNYSWHRAPPCDKCGHTSVAPLHIGRSSGGWCFGLHVYPESGPLNLGEWTRLWESGVILDGYDEEVSLEQMLDIITDRGESGCRKEDALWYQRNSAMPGPKGLARHRIDTQHCIGHGKGTWDLLVGDFS